MSIFAIILLGGCHAISSSFDQSRLDNDIKVWKELIYDTTISITIRGFEKRSDLPDGHWVIMYNNGKIKEDFWVKNKKIHGNLKWFWPNGHVMYRGTFEHGKIRKYWYTYGSDGMIDKKIVYDENENKKKVYQYYEGCLESITYFQEGIEFSSKRFKCPEKK